MRCSGSHPRRPGTCACCSGQDRSTPEVTNATPISSPCWKAALPRCPTGRTSNVGPLKAWPGGPGRSGGEDLQALSVESSCGRKRATSSGWPNCQSTARSLTRLAESVLEVALSVLSGARPEGVTRTEGVAVVAMGRFGGAELAYSSDLDVLFVFDDDKVSPEEAESLAEALLKLMNGETPVQRLYELDLSLRPEGRQGPLARSLNAFESYYSRWALVWERQALTRGRFVAGDPAVGARFSELAQRFLWSAPLSDAEVREIRLMKARVERERVPAGEDPEFHLKLGPGSLSDVEWTVQLLQLRSGVRAEGTLDAVDAARRSRRAQRRRRAGARRGLPVLRGGSQPPLLGPRPSRRFPASPRAPSDDPGTQPRHDRPRTT